MKFIDPSEKLEKVRDLVIDLSRAFKPNGELLDQQPVQLPSFKVHTSSLFDADKALIDPKDRKNYLFYTDAILLLSDAAAILLHRGTAETQASLNAYSFLRSSDLQKRLLIEIAGSRDDEKLVSETIAHSHRDKILKLLQAVARATIVEFSEAAEEINQDLLEDEVDELDEQINEPPAPTGVSAAPTTPEEPETGGADQLPPQEEEVEPTATRDDLEKMQYEATWIYNRALHELFVSKDISYAYLEANPELKNLLLNEVMEIMLSKDKAEIGLLFANPRRRLEILDELYLKISRSPQFVAALENFYKDYTLSLPEEEREAFAQHATQLVDSLKNHTIALEELSGFTTGYNFRQELKDVLKSDSPTIVGLGTREFTQVEGRIQVALKSLLINQGAEFEFVNIDVSSQASLQSLATHPHTAAWLLQHMSDEHLLLMLGIPEEYRLTEDAIRRLRKLLIKYAQLFAVELALEAEKTSLSAGLAPLSGKEADELAAGNHQIFERRLLPSLSSASSSVQEHGAERVARAVTNSVKDQHKRHLIAWNALSPDEKTLIYEYLGHDLDKITDRNMVPTNIHLLNFAELQMRAQEAIQLQAEIDQERLFQLETAHQEAIYIENLRRFYVESFIAQTSLEERERILEQLEYESLAALHQASLMELIQANEAAVSESHGGAPVGAGGDRTYSADDVAGVPAGIPGAQRPPPGGIRGRFASARSRFTDRFSKKVDARGKALSALKKAGGDKLATKALAAAGPWGKAAALLADKKKRKWILGALAVGGAFVVQGLIKMFTAGISGLIGGLVGGIGGGIAGFLIGGPVGAVVGAGLGAAVGANAGAAIGGGGFSLPSFGGSTGTSSYPALGSSSLPPSAQTAGATTGATGTATAGGSYNVAGTAASYLSTLPVGTAAAAGTIAGSILISLITLLIIFAAFLGPLPASYKSSTFDRTLSNFEGCWPTTGVIRAYQNYDPTLCAGCGGPHAVIRGGYGSYPGDGVAIDITTWDNSASDGGANAPVFTPYAGTASFYPDGTGMRSSDGQYKYGTHVIVDTGSYIMIFAHLLDFAPGISMSNITRDLQVQAGELLGRVDSTGNSSGNHLHFETVGIDVLDILPLTAAEKSAIRADESAIYGMSVNSRDCAAAQDDDDAGVSGYVAIGPKTADNFVVSNSAEASSPKYTCDWFRNNPELDVAINANYYNTPTQPIGIGGANPPVYFANANGRDPAYMEQTMRMFTVDNSGNFRIDPVPSAWYNRTDMPFVVGGYQKAVTGVLSDHPDGGGERNRVALGYGNANGECTDFTGEAIIFASIRTGNYSDLADIMQQCGADQFIFLDSGGSASFCSNSLSMPGGRPMPVNIGLKNAFIQTVGTSN